MLKLVAFIGIAGAFVSSAFGNPVILPSYEFNAILTTSDTPLTPGFWFQTNRPVIISDLGYFDADGDGFGVQHNVGLFDALGILLTSTTLSAGTADPLDGHFRYQAITPLTLSADTWYVVAGTTGGSTDQWGYGFSNTIGGLSVSPLIVVPANAAVFVYQPDDTLQFPTNQFGYQFYAGPNMLLEDTGVPEPGSASLVFLGALVLGLGGFRNLRNRRRS